MIYWKVLQGARAHKASRPPDPPLTHSANPKHIFPVDYKTACRISIFMSVDKLWQQCAWPTFAIKLRFHLCVTWMWTTNAKNQSHRISIGVLPFVQMQTRTVMLTKWIAAYRDRSECEWFTGQENNSHTEPPKSCVCHAEIKLHWCLLICIHYSYSHSHNARVES